MHNVKKTPASEAFAANEAKKRKEKLQLYHTVRDKIFLKRKNDEYDEEILSLTAELLKKNPDIYTFWNIRRKAILLIIKKKNEEEELYEKRVLELFEDELELTKDTLFVNPKSYGAWHHRFWAVKKHPSPNLQKELDLCEKALSVDSRNFHCWDHRRFVAKLANLTEEDELMFSDKLITQNPSNYSAWHYRATLLPLVRPDIDTVQTKLTISEECLHNEFEKTKNVCCMNSEDQSAWTYCRWLCEIVCSDVDKKCVREGARKCLEQLIEFCEELIKIDKEDVPWEFVALARAKLFLFGPTSDTVKELSKLFATIKKLDPQRKLMYEDILRKIKQQSLQPDA